MRKLLPTAVSIGVLAAASCGGDPYQEFTVQGELVSDNVQHVPGFGDVYRIVMEVGNGKQATYPILASPEEMRELDDMLTSREENGEVGDLVGVNPNSNVFTIDEVMLMPDNVVVLEKSPWKERR